ncbi:hypothetical protein BT96DRAFT_974193 [Gymnopus androsaceus JB14]|uniref:Apple domain-containing protein n=1 Tax=Gymnopus androsaceus JB14 TaxID=1447944 RepID=A0A6A4HWI4_9AGAR|nr:hypothetical protein BT96DRAFT_974193 [Gymnopus androsaceus JB14]
MLFKFLLAVSALAAPAFAQSCAEASRFGDLTFSPNPIVLGEPVTFNASFACATELGYAPLYTDYTLVVPPANNTGFQAPIYFARRDAPAGGNDVFTVTFDPNYSQFTTYPDAQYEIILAATHVAESDSYGQTLIQGEVEFAVTINQASRSGYTETFSNLSCATQASDYITYGLVDTVADCETMCTNVSGCTFFNIYYDYNSNPKGNYNGNGTQLTCSLFQDKHTASDATNCGNQPQSNGGVDTIENSCGWYKSS